MSKSRWRLSGHRAGFGEAAGCGGNRPKSAGDSRSKIKGEIDSESVIALGLTSAEIVVLATSTAWDFETADHSRGPGGGSACDLHTALQFVGVGKEGRQIFRCVHQRGTLAPRIIRTERHLLAVPCRDTVMNSLVNCW